MPPPLLPTPGGSSGSCRAFRGRSSTCAGGVPWESQAQWSPYSPGLLPGVPVSVPLPGRAPAALRGLGELRQVLGWVLGLVLVGGRARWGMPLMDPRQAGGVPGTVLHAPPESLAWACAWTQPPPRRQLSLPTRRPASALPRPTPVHPIRSLLLFPLLRPQAPHSVPISPCLLPSAPPRLAIRPPRHHSAAPAIFSAATTAATTAPATATATARDTLPAPAATVAVTVAVTVVPVVVTVADPRLPGQAAPSAPPKHQARPTPGVLLGAPRACPPLEAPLSASSCASCLQACARGTPSVRPRGQAREQSKEPRAP